MEKLSARATIPETKNMQQRKHIAPSLSDYISNHALIVHTTQEEALHNQLEWHFAMSSIASPLSLLNRRDPIHHPADTIGYQTAAHHRSPGPHVGVD